VWLLSVYGIGLDLILKGVFLMLVLSRKVAERILITSPEGVQISLMMVEIRGDKARIGIDAPKDWKIHREEVQRAIEKSK